MRLAWALDDADDDRPRRWGVAMSADNGTNWTFRVVGENMKCANWPTEPSGVYLGYYQRDAGILRRRTAKADEVFDRPQTWPESEVLVNEGDRAKIHAGNVNATSAGDRHHLAWYSGTDAKCAVLTLSTFFGTAN